MVTDCGKLKLRGSNINVCHMSLNFSLNTKNRNGLIPSSQMKLSFNNVSTEVHGFFFSARCAQLRQNININYINHTIVFGLQQYWLSADGLF